MVGSLRFLSSLSMTFLVALSSSCAATHAAANPEVALTHVCVPAPIKIIGHHDVDVGTLSVRAYESSDTAATSLQAACTQAANVVLANWERGRCADYTVAAAEGKLLGDAAVEPSCTSPICPVVQTCAVHIVHIPDFVYALKK